MLHPSQLTNGTVQYSTKRVWKVRRRYQEHPGAGCQLKLKEWAAFCKRLGQWFILLRNEVTHKQVAEIDFFERFDSWWRRLEIPVDSRHPSGVWWHFNAVIQNWHTTQVHDLDGTQRKPRSTNGAEMICVSGSARRFVSLSPGLVDYLGWYRYIRALICLLASQLRWKWHVEIFILGLGWQTIPIVIVILLSLTEASNAVRSKPNCSLITL